MCCKSFMFPLLLSNEHLSENGLSYYLHAFTSFGRQRTDRTNYVIKPIFINNECLDLSMSSKVMKKGILRKLRSCTNGPWRLRRLKRLWRVRKHHLLTRPMVTRSACEAPPSYLTHPGDRWPFLTFPSLLIKYNMDLCDKPKQSSGLSNKKFPFGK